MVLPLQRRPHFRASVIQNRAPAAALASFPRLQTSLDIRKHPHRASAVAEDMEPTFRTSPVLS
eukprot:2566376-Pyramimonas_sp.AAC.1